MTEQTLSNPETVDNSQREEDSTATLCSVRSVCWFSCGAASAVATKLALQERDNCEIVYQDTGAEHPDNERFLKDCQEWFGQEIKIIKSEKYEDIWDVFKKTRYLVGVGGARCTAEMKRIPAEKYINHFEDDEIFGYTAEEQHRVDRFREGNPERRIVTPLIDHQLGKADCLGLLEKQGIELPAMYKLGFNNNNCIGCVKGQSGYWNRIRIHFPEVFDRMAKMERELDVAINKRYEGEKRIRVFLDELDPEAGRHEEPDMSCGLFCVGLDLGQNDQSQAPADDTPNTV